MIQRAGHGGQCCGVTHVYNIPSSPDAMIAERKKKDSFQQSAHLASYPYLYLVTNEGFPKQTAAERMAEIVKRIECGTEDDDDDDELEHGRPQGVIEVILTDEQLGENRDWHEVLTALGFELVTETENSNSGNILNIYHKTGD
jgi:hypothetical protein